MCRGIFNPHLAYVHLLHVCIKLRDEHCACFLKLPQCYGDIQSFLNRCEMLDFCKPLQKSMLCQHKPHFPLNSLSLFYDCHHSSSARQGVLIESLTRYYLFIFHKHLPLHSSFPSSSVLWGSDFGSVKLLASFHIKLGI